MRITTASSSSLTAGRMLEIYRHQRSATLEHLATGLKVRRGSDAPARLVAAVGLRQDLARAEQVADAADLARGATRAAEAALAEVNAHLLELRTLAGDSHTNTLGAAELDANRRHADKLIDDIDRVLGAASHKGRRLFDPPPVEVGVEPHPFATAGDIGSPSTPGSHEDVTREHGASAYRITGSGSNFGDTDHTYFMRNSHAGDGVMEAAVSDFVNPHSIYGRGGIMWRESDDPQSAYVSTYRWADGNVGLLYRDSFGGSTAGLYAATDDADPVFTRLTRDGDSFIGEYSADGVTYDPLGSVTVAMNVDARVGVYLNSNAAEAVTATISNVRFAAGTVPPGELPPPDEQVPRRDAGLLSGDPAVAEQNALVFNLGPELPRSLAALRFGRLDSRSLGTPENALHDLRSGGELDLLDPGHADEAMRVIDATMKRVAIARGRVGNFERHLTASADRQAAVQAEQLAAALGRLVDTDVAEATADLARLDLLARNAADALAVGREQSLLILQLLP